MKKAVVDGIISMAFTSLEEFHQRKLHTVNLCPQPEGTY